MSRDTQLKERWEQLVNILSNQFSQEDLDLDAIIYLISSRIKYTKNLRKTKIKFDAYCHLPFIRALWIL
jgi:hypothetical protein